MKEIIAAPAAERVGPQVHYDVIPSVRSSGNTPMTTTDKIRVFAQEGFFDEPRRLSEIVSELERRGFYYPSTSISPIIIRLVRKDNLLRRIGRKGSYSYVINR